MKFIAIKRKLGGKVFQGFKRVVIPGCILAIVFNFLNAPAAIDKLLHEEENMIVPGEALDPIIRNIGKPEHQGGVNNLDMKPDVNKVKDLDGKSKFTSSISPRDQKKVATLDKPSKSTGTYNKDTRSEMSFSDSDVPPRIETPWSMAKAKIPDMDKVKFKGHAITDDTVTLTLMSSADKVFMSINKKEIYRGINQRGLHVVVLNQYNGRVMAKRVFDTFQKGVEEDFAEFIDDITAGRIIVLAAEDEISHGLTWKGRNKLKELGCRFSDRIGYRDMWAMVTRKDGLKIAETFSNVATADTGYEWGGPIFMRTDFDLEERPVECEWPVTERNKARRMFCVRYEGYGKMCRCDVLQWEDVFFEADPKVHEQLKLNPLYTSLGVTIMARNRPHSLYRTLKNLHEAPGFNKDLTAVYVEAPTREIINLVKLFGVTLVETPMFKNISTPVKIRYKMQRILRDITGAKFDPKVVPDGVLLDADIPPFTATNLLVLEEDSSISIDLFKYLYTVYPILLKDPTILGISAFNHHGYREVAESQTNSYRTTNIQTFALLLPARTIHEFIVPGWPSLKDMDNEWFAGLEAEMKGEKSIVYPEIPRVKHSSYEGYLISGVIQTEIFKDHMLSLTTNYHFSPNDIDRLILSNYEKEMVETLKGSEPFIFDFCNHDLVYGREKYVMFLKHNATQYEAWSHVMKCLKTWSIYPIGGWKDIWQMKYHGHLLSIVGVPTSPYSSFKPEHYKLISAPPSNTTAKPSNEKKV